MLERDLEKLLRQLVIANNGLVYKFVCPGQQGVPDDIVIWPGGSIHFVELKQERGRLSKLQQHHIRRLNDKDVSVFVLRGRSAIEMYVENAVLATS